MEREDEGTFWCDVCDMRHSTEDLGECHEKPDTDDGPVTQGRIDRMLDDGEISVLEHWILSQALEGQKLGLKVLDLNNGEVMEV